MPSMRLLRYQRWHEYLTMPSGQYDAADVWKGFLRTLLDRRAGVLAWTTASGLDALRATWPGIVDAVHIMALEPLPDALVAEVVRAHLRKLCDELHVVLDDGFLDELTSCKGLWKGPQLSRNPVEPYSSPPTSCYWERSKLPRSRAADRARKPAGEVSAAPARTARRPAESTSDRRFPAAAIDGNPGSARRADGNRIESQTIRGQDADPGIRKHSLTSMSLIPTDLYGLLDAKCSQMRPGPVDGRALLAMINDATKVLADLLNRTCRISGDFTFHDENHAVRVVHLMHRLIGDQTSSQLHEVDLALLILAAYAHDVGMLAEKEERARILESDDFTRFTTRYESRSAEAQRAPERRRHEGLEALREQIFQDYLRERHHLQSTAMVLGPLASLFEVSGMSLASPVAADCEKPRRTGFGDLPASGLSVRYGVSMRLAVSGLCAATRGPPGSRSGSRTSRTG